MLFIVRRVPYQQQQKSEELLGDHIKKYFVNLISILYLIETLLHFVDDFVGNIPICRQ